MIFWTGRSRGSPEMTKFPLFGVIFNRKMFFGEAEVEPSKGRLEKFSIVVFYSTRRWSNVGIEHTTYWA